MKRYFQDGFRDMDGDIYIQQFTETTLASGLIVPRHISTVSVESQISTGQMVDMMGCEFHYEPDPTSFGFAEIAPVRQTMRFSVEPQPQNVFCELSSQKILEAYHALTFCDTTPRIEFATTQEIGEITEDDRAMLQDVAVIVHNVVNGVVQTPFANGQYL